MKKILYNLGVITSFLSIGFICAIYVMFQLGFRLVIPVENITPNWDAIALFASVIFSVSTLFVSFFALCFSINSTIKQNKISLFEQKYELYENMMMFIVVASGVNFLIENGAYQSSNKLKSSKEILFKQVRINKETITEDMFEYTTKYKTLNTKISLLFSDEIAKKFSELFEITSDIIPDIMSGIYSSHKENQFIQIYKDFLKDTFHEMKAKLEI